MRWVLVLAILLAAPRAHADQEYRIVAGTTNAVGASLVTLGFFGPKAAGTDNRISFALVGLAVATLGPPIVHLGYGHGDRAAISAGVHAVLPLLGAGLGDLGKPRGAGLLVGFAVGLAAAAAIDLAMATSSDDAASTRMISFGAAF